MGTNAYQPVIAAPFRNAGNPVRSRYGTGHNHESAPTARRNYLLMHRLGVDDTEAETADQKLANKV